MLPFTPPTPEQRFAYRQQFVISEDKFTPLYVLAPEENLAPEALITALDLLQHGEYELLIAGRNNFEGKVLTNVRYLGEVSEPERLYSAADFTIVITESEFSDRVVIESLKCGAPVIVSKFVSAAQVVTEDIGMVIEEETPQALAAAIREFRRQNYVVPEDFARRLAF